MRFFRHGDTLAVVLPDKLRKSSEVKEEDEYEFFEVEKGTFVLINRKNLEEQTKKSVFAELLKGKGKKDAAEEEKTASPEDSILSRGFAILENEQEAQRISKQLEKQIKEKEIIGVRGFDKKFYIVSAHFYKQNSFKILKALGSKEADLNSIASAAKMDEKGCLALLQVMKEQGELIEKRRGIFKAIR